MSREMLLAEEDTALERCWSPGREGQDRESAQQGESKERD